MAAVLVLLGRGYAVIYVNGHQDTLTNASGAEMVIAGGAILLASALAFFAYVLDMLRALVLDSRRK